MKTLKNFLLVTVLFTALTSCVREDLNEDHLLDNDAPKTQPYTGGQGQG